MSIRTVVVDDEKPARVRLLELLRRHPDVEVVGTAGDGNEALAVVRRVSPRRADAAAVQPTGGRLPSSCPRPPKSA